MVKVAIPVEKDCLSTHFRICNHYVVFTIEKSKVVDEIIIQPNFTEIEKFADWFKSLKISDVVTYKINPTIIHAFIKNKINVFVGSNQVSPKDLIQDYIGGKLKSNEDIIT